MTNLEPTLETELRILPAQAQDRYFDYCLEPYRPRRPWQDKYRSENLFWHSLAVGEMLNAFEKPVRAIQSSLGADLTVWGTKWDGQNLFWELYFYDPKKEAPEATLDALTRTLAPWLRVR